jgi:hypothetical protein
VTSKKPTPYDDRKFTSTRAGSLAHRRRFCRQAGPRAPRVVSRLLNARITLDAALMAAEQGLMRLTPRLPAALLLVVTASLPRKPRIQV